MVASGVLGKYFFVLIKISTLLLFLLLEEVWKDQRWWRGRGREGHLGGDKEKGMKIWVKKKKKDYE